MNKNFLYITTIGILLFILSACDTAEPIASFSISTTEGSSKIIITNNSTNDYFYLWDFGDGEESTEREPNHTYLGAGSYTIKLTVFSKNGKFSDTETKTLVVENANIEITSPTSSSSWETGNSYDITWNGSGSGYVKIELYKSGILQTAVVDSTTNNGTFPYYVSTSLSSSDFYKIRISKTNSENYFESDYFTITAEESENITVTSPTSSSSWETGNSYDITWNGSNSGNVKIELYRSGSFVETIINSTYNDGTFPYYVSTSLSNSDYYKIKITKTDNSAVYDESDYFTITTASSGDNIEDFETGDFSMFDWQYYTSGSQWNIGYSEVYEGSYASYSSNISDGEYATTLVTDTYNSGTISFYSKVSSEYNYDFLIFYIDGIEQDRWSGETGGWEYHFYTVSAGEHTFLWKYEKDDISNSYGDDCGYVDYIIFPTTSKEKK